MNIGERIKSLRRQNGMTQTELGNIIGVQQSAIRKYEHGEITNIPSDKIEMIAKTFNVSPAYIMGWEETQPATPDDLERWDRDLNPDGKLAKEVKLIEDVENQWGKLTVDMINLFNSLNDKGQKKAIDNVTDLTMIEQYKRND